MLRLDLATRGPYIAAMTTRSTPDTYCPGALELFWLISESPRGEFIFDDWHGRATAEDLARVLWPIDPHVVVNYPQLTHFSMNGLTPAQWVAEVLDYEARPCGRIKKDGDDYVVSVFQARAMLGRSLTVSAGNGRPYNLPMWQKN